MTPDSPPPGWPLPPRSASGPVSCGSVETTLDELLRLHQQRQADAARARAASPTDPMERLRRLFRTELVPAIDELAEKYASRGVQLKMDVEDFLQGGNSLCIDIQFEHQGLRLTGTVISSRIAFQETCYSEDAAGAEMSGPALRTRDLSTVQFREFVCQNIGALVRSVMRQTIVPGPKSGPTPP
jgi:hypothetical protein